jgi:hypothetical protein
MYMNFEVWRQDSEEDTTPRNTVVLLKVLQIQKCRMHWGQYLARGAPGLRILKGDFKWPMQRPL